VKTIPIRVECYAGYKADESPRFLFWEGRRFEVREILDRWYEGGNYPTIPSADYFKVSLREGGEVIIRLDRGGHSWYLVSERR
jgi:hypothetical protein